MKIDEPVAIDPRPHADVPCCSECEDGLYLAHSGDVAVDFPDTPIILAHPSFPGQEHALTVAPHKSSVYSDLPGRSPRYFPPILVRDTDTILKPKMLFGSNWPAITPDCWLADFETLQIHDEVRPKLPKGNAAGLLNLA